jgi:ribonucleoside-diphosphate reductase alpha chain
MVASDLSAPGFAPSRPLLNELGEKIFLDRYALKDMTKKSLAPGDTVIVCVNQKTRQREIGTVRTLKGDRVFIELRDGTSTEQGLEDVDKPLETSPDAMMDRVARGIAAIETSPERTEEWEARFRWLLDDWRFVPGGRILTAAGTDQKLTFFNCYVVPSPKDSRKGIVDTLQQMMEIMSRGGGVGINLSSLRPRHAYVKGVNGRSSGSVSWGGLYSFVTGLIEQGGSRRGALMLITNIWHPDVLDFIDAKREAGKITNANISVGVTDAFMEALEKDADWPLVFPDPMHPSYNTEWDGDLEKWKAAGRPVVVHKIVKARDVWDRIISSAWTSAEPGVFFIDRANKQSNSWYFSPLVCTNPCGEQPLPAWGICNLGALNLGRFATESGEVAWEDLRRAVRYSVRFLDNVIDATPYFIEENQRQQQAERRVGLGLMGLAELLVRCRIRYGTEESLRFIDKLGEFIATESYLASADNAAEKGSFPMFDAEKLLQSGYMRAMPERVRDAVRHKGLRNVTLLTVAPTGTTGTMVNTSTGVEPYFGWSFFRKSRLGVHEERVAVVEDWERDNPGKPLPEWFVNATELTPEEHVNVQATLQRWIDSAISKTCNAPAEYTLDETRKLYETMYRLGCKGGTIYRDGMPRRTGAPPQEGRRQGLRGSTGLGGRTRRARPRPGSLEPAQDPPPSQAQPGHDGAETVPVGLHLRDRQRRRPGRASGSVPRRRQGGFRHHRHGRGHGTAHVAGAARGLATLPHGAAQGDPEPVGRDRRQSTARVRQEPRALPARRHRPGHRGDGQGPRTRHRERWIGDSGTGAGRIGPEDQAARRHLSQLRGSGVHPGRGVHALHVAAGTPCADAG